MRLKSKLEATAETIEKRHGPFTLFGLFLREDSPNKWDLVVSAPWLEEGKLKALREFVGELNQTISEEDLLNLSRIITLNQSDRALEAILHQVPRMWGTVELHGSDLFGLSISHAYIMRAVKNDLIPVHSF